MRSFTPSVELWSVFFSFECVVSESLSVRWTESPNYSLLFLKIIHILSKPILPSLVFPTKAINPRVISMTVAKKKCSFTASRACIHSAGTPVLKLAGCTARLRTDGFRKRGVELTREDYVSTSCNQTSLLHAHQTMSSRPTFCKKKSTSVEFHFG